MSHDEEVRLCPSPNMVKGLTYAVIIADGSRYFSGPVVRADLTLSGLCFILPVAS